MYRTFVNETIKEFQYNYEEEKNRFIVAFFSDGDILRNNSRKDLIGYNFYICGLNREKIKYIIRKIPCYLYKSMSGEFEPTYNYGTHVDNYFEEFDEMIIEFADLLKNRINYEIHNTWTDGILSDNTFMMFYFENPNIYFGKIDEPYLVFEKEKFGSLQKELITKKILLTCMNKL